jgi:hypothetical protein
MVALTLGGAFGGRQRLLRGVNSRHCKSLAGKPYKEGAQVQTYSSNAAIVEVSKEYGSRKRSGYCPSNRPIV